MAGCLMTVCPMNTLRWIATKLSNLRLAVKIVIVQGWAILAMMLLASIVTSSGVDDLVSQSGSERIREEVQLVQAQFATVEQQILTDTTYLAQSVPLSDAVNKRAIPDIETTLLLSDATDPLRINRALVVDQQGESLVLAEDRKIVPPPAEPHNNYLDLALLGISVTGVVESDGLYLVAAVPVQTRTGVIIGAILAGRRIDGSLLGEISFYREDVHMALVRSGKVTALYMNEGGSGSVSSVNTILGGHPGIVQDNPDVMLSRNGIHLDDADLARAQSGEVVLPGEFIDSRDEYPLAVAYVPIKINNDLQGVLVILVDLRTMSSFRDDLITDQLLAFLIAGVLIALALGVLVWRTVAVPINRLQSVTSRISSGDYQQRAQVHSNDEVGELADAFNEMAERLYARDKQIAAEIGERNRAEQALRIARDGLEQRVIERTIELQQANDRLEEELAQRIQAETQIKAALEEKEVLLREIHHRVKNNLQVTSSLLRLQANHTDDPVTMGILQESQHRVRSMALVHERLYQSSDLSRIPARVYIEDLLRYLSDSYELEPDQVALDITVDDIAIDIDTAIPCGLIVNELVSNAYKHAFPDGRKGRIEVTLHGSENRLSSIAVRDDGVGFQTPIEVAKARSLGLQLVTSLSKQLGGTVEFHNDQGTVVVLELD